jgi:hypothetical protein
MRKRVLLWLQWLETQRPARARVLNRVVTGRLKQSPDAGMARCGERGRSEAVA